MSTVAPRRRSSSGSISRATSARGKRIRVPTRFCGKLSSNPSARKSAGTSEGFRFHSSSLLPVAEPTTAIGMDGRLVPIRSMNCSTALALVKRSQLYVFSLLMASSTALHDVGGTMWIVGHSTTRAPRASSPDRNSADCEAARVMTTVLPVSGILRDLGKDFSGSHCQEFLTEFHSERGRIVAGPGDFVLDHSRSINAGDEAFDNQPSGFQPGSSSYRNLTASTQRSQKPAFCRHGSSRRGMIEDRKQSSCFRIV